MASLSQPTHEHSAITQAVSSALSVPDALLHELGIDLGELRDELHEVAAQALAAREAGLGLSQAVRDARFSALVRFHTDLRDSLLVEIPTEIRGFVQSATSPQSGPGDAVAGAFGTALADLARGELVEPASQALAELMVFEAVRLRLLVSAWQSEDFERVGGSEEDIDAIAAQEVEILLEDPALDSGEVRPLPLMVAAASVSLARDAADRAEALRLSGDDLREELAMQARLRKALRALRLPESVLLSNALSNLLGETRQELPDLQHSRPVALAGLSRQAMDQRVSRGRKALTMSPEAWPRRKGAALVDLLTDDAV